MFPGSPKTNNRVLSYPGPWECVSPSSPAVGQQFILLLPVQGNEALWWERARIWPASRVVCLIHGIFDVLDQVTLCHRGLSRASKDVEQHL